MNTPRTTNAAEHRARRRKLPSRYAVVVVPLMLSVLMTCIVSFISTVRSIGFASGFIQVWFGSWGLSWLVAFPTLLFVLPLVRRTARRIVEDA